MYDLNPIDYPILSSMRSTLQHEVVEAPPLSARLPAPSSLSSSATCTFGVDIPHRTELPKPAAQRDFSQPGIQSTRHAIPNPPWQTPRLAGESIAVHRGYSAPSSSTANTQGYLPKNATKFPLHHPSSLPATRTELARHTVGSVSTLSEEDVYQDTNMASHGRLAKSNKTQANAEPSSRPAKAASSSSNGNSSTTSRDRTQSPINMKEPERAYHIRNDPWARNVTENWVTCMGCGSSITLVDRKQKYASSGWIRHRKICQLIQRVRLAESRRLGVLPPQDEYWTEEWKSRTRDIFRGKPVGSELPAWLRFDLQVVKDL